jgi:DNA polymerase V
MSKNIYALIDCDNFYVSCERVFRPDLREKPVAVLSNNDGCIVSRSNEVKALDIKMGSPYFEIEELEKKNNIHIFSSNYALYSDISQRIVRTLEKFAPEIEVYSIDESFIKLNMDKDRCLEYGREIRETILQEVGVPTTVGIAYTKTLTKVASKVAKKNPQYEGVLSLLDIETNDRYLNMVEVDDVWGVGRKYSQWLRARGINSAKDLKYADREEIRRKMTVGGYRTVMELNNVECIPLEESPPTKKSIVSSKSFGELTSSLSDIKRELARDITRAGEKLRKEECMTGYITVFITTSRFRKPYYSNSIGIKLPYPVSDTATLVKYALAGLDKIFKRGYRYKKTGAMLTDITPVNDIQLNFAVNDFLSHTEDKDKIMNSIDSINRKWGRDTVKVAAMGIEKKSLMKQQKKSPRYTTSWEELLIVNI